MIIQINEKNGNKKVINKGNSIKAFKFTMLTSGWLLVLSGAFSLLTCTSPVPLFGAMRGGIVAVIYNVAFGVSLAAMGYALARRKLWALKATAFATAIYTADKLIMILDSRARTALDQSPQLFDSLDPGMVGMVDQIMVKISIAFLAGWWGLVIYILINRNYFSAKIPENKQ